MKPVRVSAKAIIERDNKVLLVRCRDELGDWYLFPGGGQEPGETLHDTLRREVREETGLEIVPGDLRFVRDYIARNHEFAAEDPETHQVELYFNALPADETGEARVGDAPDRKQTGVEWVALDRLAKIRIYPKCLQNGLWPGTSYLGDIN